MRLYFIRHGQSVNNALWDKSGSDSQRSEDPVLTELGHNQAQRLAEFIKTHDQDESSRASYRDRFQFTHLYCSLMERAVQTAGYIADVLDLPLLAWPEVHESGGIYLDDENGLPVGRPGRTRSYFTQTYTRLVLPETVTDEGWWNRPFEAREERPLRARGFLTTLLERHGSTNDQVAVVSHGAFYMEFVRVLVGVTNPKVWLTMNNTGISRFSFRENGEIALVYHNRTDHLPGDMIS